MIDINKVITLGNKEKYLVLDKALYNDIEYYYIAKINSAETDIENDFKLVTIEENENKKVLVEVTGEDKIREILPQFNNNI